LFKGPGTYIPRIEESVFEKIEMSLVLPNTALMIKAKRNFVDSLGIKRLAGEKVYLLLPINTIPIVALQRVRLLSPFD
jgi:major vault protein